MWRLAAILFLGVAVSAQAQTTVDVTAQNTSFSPASVTIQAGDAVRWSNAGGVHNVRSLTGPASFGSGEPSGDAWEYTFTFTVPGTYTYQCSVHGALMQGTVVVQGGTAEEARPEAGFALLPDGPNPFPERAAFRLTAARAQAIRVAVVDPLGREVAVLFDGAVRAGVPTPLVWHAEVAAPGAYFLRVEGEEGAVTRGLVRSGPDRH